MIDKEMKIEDSPPISAGDSGLRAVRDRLRPVQLSEYETWSTAQVHGIDLSTLLRELNETLS